MRSRYRPELQGLRALACVLVVVYHVWLGRISGGVDVFFLVSGFLITGQLVRAGVRGRIELRATWGRMIKRLFPAALTVLLVVAAASVVLLPQARWLQTIREVLASALYLENWRLAADSADYFAQHDAASVVQHFWSLAIQGQFYVVWPLLFAFVFWARLRPVFVLAVLFAGSLAFSIWLTAVNQPLAYFHSLTRVWEFALGGLLALAIDRIVLPHLAQVLVAWLGIIGLVSCGLVFQVGTVFPGFVALWPTLSAALVLLGGGAERVLSTRPLKYVGNLSFSLYLWHWPVLVFYLVVRERAEVGLLGGAFVIGLSALLAVATYHLIENPVRLTNWGAYRFAAVAMLPLAAVLGGWQLYGALHTIPVGDRDHPGAMSRTAGFEYDGASDAPLAPSFISLPEDWAWIDNCEDSPRGAELQVCRTESDEPERRIVIVGDSHPTQFIAALEPIAQRRNWQLIVMSRGGCPFSVDSEIVPDDAACRDWNAAAADEIIDLQPDAVFTTATREVRVGLTEYTPPGFVAQWQKLDQANIPVFAVRDNPRYDFDPSACAETNGQDAPECATARADLLAAEAPYTQLDDVPPNVSFGDFSDYYCTADVCPPVLGNVLIYLDNNHVSATYLSTMSSIVERALDTALGWPEPDAPEPA